MRLLIVDDDPLMVSALRRALSGTSHEILEAQSAIDAISVIEKEHLDVAIIDYELHTGLTGVDVAKHTKLGTARIMLTGHSPSEMRPRIEDPLKGFLAILGKPISKARLIHVLDRIEAMKEPTR